jgi:hypothetical protein
MIVTNKYKYKILFINTSYFILSILKNQFGKAIRIQRVRRPAFAIAKTSYAARARRTTFV